MEDNLVALRLNEFETLGKGAEKIGSISVCCGLKGVFSDLVRTKR